MSQLIKNSPIVDNRGSFLKIYNAYESILQKPVKEVFYSISKRNVIRGMHFQRFPYDQEKLVHVIHGEILDVIVNIDLKASTFGVIESFMLSEKDGYNTIYVPKGYAHGFRVLSDEAEVLYLVTDVYSKKYDAGIRWDSFGFDWGINNPIMSDRDKKFKTFEEFFK